MSKSRVGVALTKCYFCNENNQILINTRLTERNAANVERAQGKIINMDPCPKCADYMKRGVILITIDESKCEPNWNRPDGSEHWMPNPHRTGGWFVITEEAARKIFDAPMADWQAKHRWMFISEEAARTIGLYDTPATEGDSNGEAKD